MQYSSIKEAVEQSIRLLKEEGSLHTVESWQGIKKPMDMWEYNNLYFQAPIPESQLGMIRSIKPTMPWAENHFQERVKGEPLNPGNEYKNWPFYQGKSKEFNDQNFRSIRVQCTNPNQSIGPQETKFSHTYMERYWPKYAGDGFYQTGGDINNFGNQEAVWKGFNEQPLKGIRYHYGDLNDVIELLKREPHTRQAYLPIWFPEDTGVLHKGRVPCSIGYHFLLRNGKLNTHYLIRACDAIRHFRNDVYLTCRLTQWVLGQLLPEKAWQDVELGTLTMDIINFHVFHQEKIML